MKGKLYLILTIILCVVSCQKDPKCPIPEVGVNISSESISANNILITAELKYPTVLDNVECIFSENDDMSNSRPANLESSESGQYRILLDNLNPLTTYYYSFRFKSADTYSESEAYITKTRDYNNISFIELPSEEKFAWSVSPISAFVYWPGCETDGLDAEDYGFCISPTNQLPNLNDRVISLKEEKFSPEISYGWEGKINELAPATKYYIRAYAVNSKGLSYSSVTEFQTPTGEIYLSLSEPDDLTITSATFNAQVLKNDGNENLTRNVGFCWSTSPHPEFDSNEYVKSEMDYIGKYNINLTGLEVNQTYYIRAFGLNDLNEPYYSNEVTFTTRDGVISLTTEVLEVHETYVYTNGVIEDDGGDAIIEKGFCWGISSNPTYNDYHISVEDLSNTLIENLNYHSTYFVRTYARNSTGTYYGNVCEFFTEYPLDELYIDEYGISHGPGITIDGITWAPVNCGYKAATADSKGYPYGKLYQWGRKVGFGYDINYDETIPIISNEKCKDFNSADNNTFYRGYNGTGPTATFIGGWCSDMPDSWTIKYGWDSEIEMVAENTPCPSGWRLPTETELSQLANGNHSDLCFNTALNQWGRWFYGNGTGSIENDGLFLPASGYISGSQGIPLKREEYGIYWTDQNIPRGLFLSNTDVTSKIFQFENIASDSSSANSVRCVKDND